MENNPNIQVPQQTPSSTNVQPEVVKAPENLNSQNGGDNRKPKGSLFQVLVLLLLFAIFGLAAYIAHWVYANSPSGLTKPTTSPVVRKTVCDKTDAEHGCMVNSFQVVAPKSGEQICLGTKYDIKWTAPSDMETVKLTLRQGDDSTGQEVLGIFPASAGKYSWSVVGVSPGTAYKMWINSSYKGNSVNNASSGLFTIKQCP